MVIYKKTNVMFYPPPLPSGDKKRQELRQNITIIIHKHKWEWFKSWK